MYCQITRIAPWRSLIMTLWGLKNPFTTCKQAVSMHITPSFMCMLSNFNLKTHNQLWLYLRSHKLMSIFWTDQKGLSIFKWNLLQMVGSLSNSTIWQVIYICIVGLSTLQQHKYIYIYSNSPEYLNCWLHIQYNKEIAKLATSKWDYFPTFHS